MEALTASKIEEMKIQELRDALRKAGMKVGGTKPELQSRLLQYIAGETTENDESYVPNHGIQRIGQKRILEPEEAVQDEPCTKKCKTDSDEHVDTSANENIVDKDEVTVQIQNGSESEKQIENNITAESDVTKIEHEDVESTTVENTNVENTNVENTIVENTIVENTIVENTNVENTTVENTNNEKRDEENGDVDVNVKNENIENTNVENTKVEDANSEITNVENTDSDNTSNENSNVEDSTSNENSNVEDPDNQNTNIVTQNDICNEKCENDNAFVELQVTEQITEN